MKKLQLLVVLLSLGILVINSQDWEKSTDFIGLDSYCSLNGSFIGTSNGVIGYSSYNNEWKHLGLSGRKVYALYHYNVIDNDTLIAGTDNGIYVSPDRGANWILTNAPQSRCNNIEIKNIYSYDRVIYACFENGVYYSDHDLTNWKFLGLQGDDYTNYVGLASDTVSVFASRNGLIFYGEKYGKKNKTAQPESYITEVVDMANYWTGSYNDAPVSILITPNAVYTTNKDSLYLSKLNNYEWVKKWTAPSGVILNCIHMFTSGNFTLGTNQGLYGTSDKGLTIVKQGTITSPVTSINFPNNVGNTDFYYTTLGGGFYKNSTLLGYSNIQVLKVDADGALWVGTNGFGVFKSSANHKSWEQRNAGLTNLDIKDIQIISTGDMYLATKGGAFLSSNRGESWTPIQPMDVQFYSIMEAHPNDGITVFGSGNGSFYRLQSNFNWNGGAQNLSGDIYVIRYNPKMNKYLAAGKQGLWWSDTDFIQWIKVTAFPYKTIYDIEIEKDGRMLAVTQTDIYYSDNNGVDWLTTTFIPKNYKTDLTIDAGGNYYVSTDGGVYYSTDRGVSWTELNAGLPNLPYSVFIDCVELDKDNHLWAGSKTTGLFRTTNPVYTPTGIPPLTDHANLPVRYDAAAGTLHISLTEAESSTSTIRLHSISGASMCTLSVSHVLQNKQELKLPAIQPGMYILSIESNAGRRTRKLVL